MPANKLTAFFQRIRRSKPVVEIPVEHVPSPIRKQLVRKTIELSAVRGAEKIISVGTTALLAWMGKNAMPQGNWTDWLKAAGGAGVGAAYGTGAASILRELREEPIFNMKGLVSGFGLVHPNREEEYAIAYPEFPRKDDEHSVNSFFDNHFLTYSPLKKTFYAYKVPSANANTLKRAMKWLKKVWNADVIIDFGLPRKK